MSDKQLTLQRKKDHNVEDRPCSHGATHRPHIWVDYEPCVSPYGYYAWFEQIIAQCPGANSAGGIFR